MSDGGDWNVGDPDGSDEVDVPLHLDAVVPSKQTEKPAESLRVRAPMRVALGAVVMSMMGALVAGVAVRVGESMEAQKLADEAQAEATQRQEEQRKAYEEREKNRRLRENASKTIRELQPELREVWRQFDFETRDITTGRLLTLSKHSPGVYAVGMHKAGAGDVLMKMPQFNGKGWARYMMRHESWDAAKILDESKVRGTWIAAGLCAAGEQGAAMNRLKRDLQPAESRELALACDPTDSEVIHAVNKERLTDAEAGIIATRNTDQVRRAYQDFSPIRDNRDSPSLLALTARQFVKDEVRQRVMVQTAANTIFACTGLPLGESSLDELPPPELFQEVLTKLGPDIDPRAIDTLNTAIVRAGALRMQDTRGYEPTSVDNQLCIAQADYFFEPSLAVARLQKLAAETDNDMDVVRMLAMAKARAGDFEGAYQTAKTFYTPRGKHRADMQWMLVAFAHMANRELDVELGDVDYRLEKWRQAYAGDDASKQTYRMDVNEPSAPLTLVFYLQALLAPGHEEAFLDAQMADGASVAYYTFSRAEAARWRKDAAAEKVWNERLERQFGRFAGGEFGGLYMLWTPPR